MANNDIKPVTKDTLDQAVDAILAGMDRIAGNLKEEFKKELDPLKADVKFIKRDIQDLKADLSGTPSRREFTNLKDKVDDHLQYHKD